MFECLICEKKFQKKNSLSNHLKSHNPKEKKFKCVKCAKNFRFKSELTKHYVSHQKKEEKKEFDELLKKINYKTCELCSTCVLEEQFINHLRSLSHRLKEETGEVKRGAKILCSSFRNRIVGYRIENELGNENYLEPKDFLDSKLEVVKELLTEELTNHLCIKTYLDLSCLYYNSSTEEKSVKSIIIKNRTITLEDNISENVLEMRDEILALIEIAILSGSGWSYSDILFLDLYIAKSDATRAGGGSFIHLPPNIRNKCATINLEILNSEEECFLFCVALSVFKNKISKPYTEDKIRPYIKFFNTNGLKFPLKICDVKKFMELNKKMKVSVSVFKTAFNGKNFVVTNNQIKNTQKLMRHVELLLHEEKGKSHYTLITNLKALLKNQITKSHRKSFMCCDCFSFFDNKKNLNLHETICNQEICKMPPEGAKLEFKNIHRLAKPSHVAFADFECILEDIETNENDEHNENISYTKKIAIHKPIAFCYIIKCLYDPKVEDITRQYFGLDAADKFIDLLRTDAQMIYNKHDKNFYELDLNDDVKKQIEILSSDPNGIKCFLCKKITQESDIVFEHFHLQEKNNFRGLSCSSCNLKYKQKHVLTCVLHNLERYDGRLFIQSLARYKEKISVIAKNKTTYKLISQSFRVDEGFKKVGNKTKKFFKNYRLKFIDSMNFLPSSLENLVKNLTRNEFETVRKNYPSHSRHLCFKKGIYPYSYAKNIEMYETKQLPNIEHFKNSLTGEECSIEDYEIAKECWSSFNIKNFREYTQHYCKLDVVLLTDVFIQFMKLSESFFGLTPINYCTGPSLFFDSFLYTNTENIELITDVDKFNFFRDNVKGGLCQSVRKKNFANNMFMEDKYDTNKPDSFITYFDYNSLYSFAQMQLLPTRDFAWLNEKELKSFTTEKIMQLDDESSQGFVFEVNIEYPRILHDHPVHRDIPFLPESFPCGKIKKLCTTLHDKEKYVIHFKHLKLAIRHGLILKKVTRGLKFTQTAFLKSFIEKNIHQRNLTDDPFQKLFWKLCNNSTYGKFLVNERLFKEIYLISQWNGKTNSKTARKLIASHYFHSMKCFEENLTAIEMTKSSYNCFNPIQVAFCVLEISKILLYQFSYECIPRLFKNSSIIYMDTDSMVHYIEGYRNIYEQMKSCPDILLKFFDTSNLQRYGIPEINIGVPGKMKAELGEQNIEIFVGLRQKCYGVQTSSSFTAKSAGLIKSSTKSLTIENYLDVFESKTILYKKFRKIGCENLKLYTFELNKIALSSSDDKRVLLDSDKGLTIPHGHYSLLE